MSRDSHHGVNQFLDLESKVAVSQTNRGSRNALQNDSDVHCFRATSQYAACSGAFARLQVGPECLQFCQTHINEVMAKIFNIMFSGHIKVQTEDNEIVTLSHPSAYVEYDNGEPTQLVTFDENNMRSAARGQTFGDWVVSQFDFRRRDWERVAFDFMDLEDLDYDEVYYELEDHDYVLQEEDYQILVINKMYGVVEMPEVETEALAVQEECALRDCTSAIRGSVLDPRCIVFCREKMNLAMADILKLLTSSRIFVQDQNGFSYQLSEDWKIKVIGVDGSPLLMMESRYDLGEDALQHSDFTSPDWVEVRVIFEKENTYHAPSTRESHIVTMWAQQDDKSVFLKGFHESQSEVTVVIPNPQHVNMETPD